MNITDLREELAAHAHLVHADSASIAEGVTGRIRTAKRRRTAAVTGGLCAAALAVGVVLTNQGSPVMPAPVPAATLGADGMPSRLLPDKPGDVVKDGLRYRAKVGEDTLAAGVIGDAGGQRSLAATWTPTTTHISYVAECWLLPGTDQAVAEDTMVRASISGAEGYVESSCDSRPPDSGDLASGGYVPGEAGQGHPELQIGATTTLTVELVTRDGTPAAVPGARLAAAVYDLGEQRSIEDDAGHVVGVLPQVVEHQGYRYLLEPVVHRPLGSGALPTLKAPASGPYVVTFGTVGTGAWGADPGFFQLDGLASDTSLVQEGGLTTAPQAAGSGQTLGLRLAEGTAPKVGYGVIAIYVPAG
jgi:hypothetical protein